MKQLRFTTTPPHAFAGAFDNSEENDMLVIPKEVGELVMDSIKGQRAYIHGDAEDLAGYDIPVLIDGNLGQLELPVDEQDILMLLPSGEYKCQAKYNDTPMSSNCYLITLKK